MLTCMVHGVCHEISSAVLDFFWSGTLQHRFQLDTPSQEAVHATSGAC